MGISKALGKTKIGQIKTKVVDAAAAIKDLPRDQLLETFDNDLKKKVMAFNKKNDPITEAELLRDLKGDWKKVGWVYRRAGVSFEELVSRGNAILTMEITEDDVTELPPMVAKVVNVISRKGKCPCGSGKKYKRCCGK